MTSFYKFVRLGTSLGNTDVTAQQGLTMRNGLVLRLYKVNVQIGFNLAAITFCNPTLGWVDVGGGVMQDAMEAETIIVPVGAFQYSMTRDYPDGRPVFPVQAGPAAGGLGCLGLVDTAAVGALNSAYSIEIDYGWDVDYRVLNQSQIVIS